jgi:hypothetical protein
MDVLQRPWLEELSRISIAIAVFYLSSVKFFLVLFQLERLK